MEEEMEAAGLTTFDREEITTKVKLGLAAAKRYEAAEKAARRLVAEVQVSKDKGFWSKRISRAMEVSKFQVTNEWSFRGSTSTSYMEALQKVLGPEFNVQYRHPYVVVVSW
jgi:hypothetical protein